jgi:hypothetical protein
MIVTWSKKYCSLVYAIFSYESSIRHGYPVQGSSFLREYLHNLTKEDLLKGELIYPED